jgi:hypothetical protein
VNVVAEYVVPGGRVGAAASPNCSLAVSCGVKGGGAAAAAPGGGTGGAAAGAGGGAPPVEVPP